MQSGDPLYEGRVLKAAFLAHFKAFVRANGSSADGVPAKDFNTLLQRRLRLEQDGADGCGKLDLRKRMDRLGIQLHRYCDGEHVLLKYGPLKAQVDGQPDAHTLEPPAPPAASGASKTKKEKKKHLALPAPEEPAEEDSEPDAHTLELTPAFAPDELAKEQPQQDSCASPPPAPPTASGESKSKKKKKKAHLALPAPEESAAEDSEPEKEASSKKKAKALGSDAAAQHCNEGGGGACVFSHLDRILEEDDLQKVKAFIQGVTDCSEDVLDCPLQKARLMAHLERLQAEQAEEMEELGAQGEYDEGQKAHKKKKKANKHHALQEVEVAPLEEGGPEEVLQKKNKKKNKRLQEAETAQQAQEQQTSKKQKKDQPAQEVGVASVGASLLHEEQEEELKKKAKRNQKKRV